MNRQISYAISDKFLNLKREVYIVGNA